jgi:hypothetical protein
MYPRTGPILVAAAVAITATATAARAGDSATTVSNAIQAELGVFVYPKSEQDAATQAKDTVECYDSAKQRTGIDLKAPPPAVETPEPQAGGAMRGRQQQKRSNANAEQQAAEQAAATAAERKATLNKAFSACMDARSYSVK